MKNSKQEEILKLEERLALLKSEVANSEEAFCEAKRVLTNEGFVQEEGGLWLRDMRLCQFPGYFWFDIGVCSGGDFSWGYMLKDTDDSLFSSPEFESFDHAWENYLSELDNFKVRELTIVCKVPFYTYGFRTHKGVFDLLGVDEFDFSVDGGV